ncbi:putative pectate lyase [Helianthus anomalus]
MNHHYFVLVILSLIFANVLPFLSGENENIIAGIEDYEDQNAGNANAGAAMEAYNPELLEASLQRNTSRSDLLECASSNPIDKCWRGKADWADTRQALAQCVIGFAKGTTGGAAGEIYTVTDPSDADGANPKEGTLRWGAAQKKPLWIIFEKDMVIVLKHTLVLTSDKTIDGRGARVEIAYGGGITIQEANNVIIHGISVHDVRVMDGFAGRSACDGDALTIKTASKIWIDHCDFSKGPDGLLDVTVGSTAVTISNNRFHDHDKVRTANHLKQN